MICSCSCGTRIPELVSEHCRLFLICNYHRPITGSYEREQITFCGRFMIIYDFLFAGRVIYGGLTNTGMRVLAGNLFTQVSAGRR